MIPVRAGRLTLLSILAVACGQEAAAPSIPFRVTRERGDLLYVWVDAQGVFRDAQRVDDIAADRRRTVRVEPLGLDPARRAPPDLVYLVDLSAVGPDGSYPVRTAPRTEFEALGRTAPATPEVVAGTDPHTAAAPPTGPEPGTAAGTGPGPATATAGAPRVVIYGAEWCGACHQAQAYLRRRGVPFVDRDVDRDPAARRAMQAALARVGRRPGAIPVIEVGDQVLVGFDAGAIERALSSS